jgi:hypothetical protein
MGRPRLVPAGSSFWLIAADAPLVLYDSAPIDRRLRDLTWVSTCAVAHEAVVEHLAKAGTVIPMKLFTLFASDERALVHIRQTRARLAQMVRRVAGRHEWGVRVSFDPERAPARSRRPPREAARGRPGTRFLMRKKTEQHAARRLAAQAHADVEWAFRQLRRGADDARRRAPLDAEAGARVLLDAVFLVPSTKVTRFQAAVKGVSARLVEAGCAVTLTGPWPPYNFVAGRA